MEYSLIAGKYKVSKVGIGGHYSKMEEGRFEYNYAQVSAEEVRKRAGLIEKAVDSGINYFDTTWRNESDMLAESIRPLNIRDKIFINGMVLGTFRGSKAYGITPSEYLEKWLDDRLKKMPGNRFNSFMINAIDEDYDESKCEQVLNTLEKRRKNGDFDVIGFSCHNHRLAREIADKYPEFQLIMLAYNYKNRSFDQYFSSYEGKAAFVAMKPLIWYEYGIPFCCINNLPENELRKLLDSEKKDNIAESAVRWNLSNKKINTCVCAINNEEELKSLIMAGSGHIEKEEERNLESYKKAIEAEKRIPYLISSLKVSENNRRALFFGISSLSNAIGYKFEKPGLNEESSDERLSELKGKLISELKDRGYGRYI